MKLERFIRIDEKGDWRGPEHRSSMGGMADYWDNDEEFESAFHDGVSCYSLSDTAYAVERLRYYWMEHLTWRKATDYAPFQITIFEGENLKKDGPDYEDLAICATTIAEVEAVPFMEKLIGYYHLLTDEEMTQEEYDEKLVELVREWL